MKTYPIFLASSHELEPERLKFGNFIRRHSDLLEKNNNVKLRLEIWEDMGAELNKSRKQDDYNRMLHEAEIVLVFFWTKMGKYTSEEFDLAYQRFLETGKPLIYVYEKTEASSKPTEDWEKQSKAHFLKMLLTPGKEQFHSTFNNYGELEAHFLNTLTALFSNKILTYGECAKMLSPNGPIVPNPFLGREKELKSLEERFETNPQTLLIHAEGGMGKTTLASKYWYESEYRYSHQAWLFCDQGIMDALKTLVPKLGLDPRTFNSLEEADQIATLKTAISNLEGDFLLVLDNANDAEQIQEFLRYFRGFSWNVLITCRCTEILESTRDEILLQHLNPEDAKKLFLEYYQEDNEDFEQLLGRFLEGLNYHSLLIEIFAKNLKESAEMGMDLKGFLEELETKGLVLDADNNFEVKSAWAGNVDKKADTTNDILGVLYDFGQLIEEERLFLVNMSLLPSESYTLPFLWEIFNPEDKRAFRDVLKNLFRKGWIGGSVDGNQTQYRLSPVIQNLVQIKNKETLWEDGKAWVKKFTNLILHEDEKDNAHTKFKWIPFGRQLVKIFLETDSNDFSLLINNLGILLRKISGKENLEEAKLYLEKALSFYIRNFGEDSPSVAICRSNLALIFLDLGGEGNLLEAREHQEKALSSDIRNFGEYSPSVAICRSNLASVLQYLGGEANLLDARGHLEKALPSDISNFGEDSPSVARVRNNLALILRDLGGEGNLLEAKDQLEKALASNTRNYGVDSPLVSLVQSSLATVFQDLGGEGNLLEAREHLENALASDIRNFGENSPNAAGTMFNLGGVLADIGDKDNLREAKKLLNNSKIIYLKHFGEGHQMLENIQSWVYLVDEKLKEMEDK